MANEILVTGAGGFVGRHLVKALRARGDLVREFSSRDGDIASTHLDFPDVRTVFHLAGRTFVPESWRAPRPFFETNLLGALNVLEFCRSQQASLVLMSSYVYGKPRSLPIAEDHPLQPFNPYALSKILAEETAAFYRDSRGVAVTIVRPFNLYGPGQADMFLIPMLIRQALDPARGYYEVADDGPRRDHLYIGDLIGLLLACAEERSGVYNAGSGRSASIAELVAAINGVLGICKELRSRGERRPDEVMDVIADIGHAENILGWKPKVDLNEGLAATITAMR